jgi:hypothetical protein
MTNLAKVAQRHFLGDQLARPLMRFLRSGDNFIMTIS